MRQQLDRPGPYTWSDFLALPDDDRRELFDGHLLETEMPSKIHEWIVAHLILTVGAWALSRGLRPLPSGFKVRVGERRGVMPDFQLISQKDWANPLNDQGYTAGRPTLAVEIISPSSRSYDRVTKLGYYAAAGVPEYWIIDIDAQRLEQYVLKAGAYVLEQQVAGARDFKSKRLRGLVLPLGPMWAMPSKRRAPTSR